MPTFNKAVELTIAQSNITATTTQIADGEKLFWQYCGTCHVVNEGGGGLAPDLAYSAIAANKESILSVVQKGALLPMGMPIFDGRLNEQNIFDIQKYILAKAKQTKK